MDFLQGLFDYLWALIFWLSGWQPGAVLKNFVQWIVVLGSAVAILYRTWQWLRGERPATKRDLAKLAQQPTANGTVAYDSTRALAEKLVEQSSLATRAEDRAATLEQQMQSKQQEIDALARTIEEMKASAKADQPGMAEALAALQRGDTVEAEILFEQIATAKIAEGAAANMEAAWALINKGNLLFLHDTQGAMGAYARAAELDPDDPEGWNKLGQLQLRIGELDAAIKSFERVLALGGSLSDQALIATATGNLGLIHLTHDDLDQAEAMFRKSLAIHKQLGRKEGMATDYGNLGLIYFKRNDLEQAEALHKKSLAIEEEQLGRKEGMARQYGNLSLIYFKRHDLDQTEVMLKKSLAMEEHLGRKEGMASDCGNLGNLYKRRGDMAQACSHWRRARDLFRELGMKPQIDQVELSLRAANCPAE
jgi:tetratricopeptide (TPR) repeat protein